MLCISRVRYKVSKNQEKTKLSPHKAYPRPPFFHATALYKYRVFLEPLSLKILNFSHLFFRHGILPVWDRYLTDLSGLVVYFLFYLLITILPVLLNASKLFSKSAISMRLFNIQHSTYNIQRPKGSFRFANILLI